MLINSSIEIKKQIANVLLNLGNYVNKSFASAHINEVLKKILEEGDN